MKTSSNKKSTETIALGAILTALVIVLQSVASFFPGLFGPFSAAVALIPIIIGCALCDTKVGAWLGFVFALVVLFTGSAALFWTFDIFGTIVTVVVKGVACGTAAGLIYSVLKKYNDTVAVFAASIACPVVNTSVFLLGCSIFFMKHAQAIAQMISSEATGMELFVGMALANFLFELGINVVLAPVIVRLLKIKRKQ